MKPAEFWEKKNIYSIWMNNKLGFFIIFFITLLIGLHGLLSVDWQLALYIKKCIFFSSDKINGLICETYGYTSL